MPSFRKVVDKFKEPIYSSGCPQKFTIRKRMSDSDFLRVAIREASLEQLQSTLGDNITRSNMDMLADLAIEEARLDVLQYLHSVVDRQVQCKHPQRHQSSSKRKKKRRYRPTFREIYHAAECGQLAIVQYLANCGAPFNTRSVEKSATPLEYAVDADDWTAVNTLLRAGARLDVPGEMEMKPLHQACRRQSSKLVKLLIEHGANVTEQDMFGCVPLDIAVQKSSVEIVENLIAMGADVDRGGSDHGSSALHLACEIGSLPVIQCLLEHGANGLKTDDSGKLPIEYAVENDRLEVVQLMVKNFGLNQPFQRQQSILHIAVGKKSYNIVNWILEQAGVDPNVRMLGQASPLHSLHDTCLGMDSSSHIKTQRTLLRHNQIDVNAMDENGLTPLHRAIKTRIRLGIETPLTDFRELLEKGADINIADRNGMTPLHYACRAKCFGENCRTALLRFLLEHGARVDMAAGPRYHGQLPLHFALSTCSLEQLKILIDSGASVGAVDDLGRNALHLVCEMGYFNHDLDEFVNLYFDQEHPDGDIDAISNDGWTALHYAVFNNGGNHVACLVRNGAKITVRNNLGQTALHMVGLGLANLDNETEGGSWALDTRDPLKWANWILFNDNVHQELLQQGADVTAIDFYGNLPFFSVASIEVLNATYEMIRLGAMQGLFCQQPKSCNTI